MEKNKLNYQIDYQKGEIVVWGISIPSTNIINESEEYASLNESLNVYFKNPIRHTTITMKFDFLNNNAKWMIRNVLREIKSYHTSKHSITLNWYYEEENDDLYDEGMFYKKIFPFTVNVLLKTD
jgi:hypothetical protein